MNSTQLRNDILAVLQARKIRLYRFARESGVDHTSLWKFIHNPKANLNTDSLFKLWPYIYGEQNPVPLVLMESCPTDPAPEREER